MTDEKINDYAVGVVTYVDRYESYFKPLIKQLTEVFPDKEIVCVINGHPDKTLQTQYLKAVTKFLSQFDNVRYMAYEEHQALAKCWNKIILLSYAPRVLMLNDDIKLDLFFRKNFEKLLKQHPDFFVINGSWSNFLISKEIVKKAGWFDERLLGCGDEDGDYMFRMSAVGLPLTNLPAHGIINYVAPQTNAGWQKFSTESNKRAKYNEEFMKTKWATHEPGDRSEGVINLVWNGQPAAASLKPGMATPDFYGIKCLTEEPFGRADLDFSFVGKKTSAATRIKLLYQVPYSLLRKNLGKFIRQIKK